MKKYIIPIILSANFLITPAIAQSDSKTETNATVKDEGEQASKEPIKTGWFLTDDGISVHHSNIILPYQLDGLDAISDKAPKSDSNGMDNAIQYRKSNSDIYATIYIYKPSFTDAELTAKMTDNAINFAFDVDKPANIFRTSKFGGNDDGAILLGYEKTGKGLSTVAAFAEIGSWILKIRVSGPESEFDGVMNTLTTALNTIKLNDSASVNSLSIEQPKTCKNVIEGKAKLVKTNESDTITNALLTGVIGQLINSTSNTEKDDQGDTPVKKISFSDWCIGRTFTYDNIQFDIYRTTDAENSNTVMPFSDTGSVIYTSSSILSKSRSLSIYNIGLIQNFSSIKGDLSAKQYDGILRGKSKLKLKLESENIIKADGDTNITLYTS